MFEGIRHIGCAAGITTAVLNAEDVLGTISFHITSERSAVISSVGPVDAVRECSSSHYYGGLPRRYKARTSEEVNDYT